MFARCCRHARATLTPINVIGTYHLSGVLYTCSFSDEAARGVVFDDLNADDVPDLHRCLEINKAMLDDAARLGNVG